MKCLGSTSLAKVMQVGQVQLIMWPDCNGWAPAVNFVEVSCCRHTMAQMCWQRKFSNWWRRSCHKFCKWAQGLQCIVWAKRPDQIIPALHSFGQLAHTRCPATVMHFAWQSVKNVDQLSSQLVKTAKEECLIGMWVMVMFVQATCLGRRIEYCDLGSSSARITAPFYAFAQDLNMLWSWTA